MSRFAATAAFVLLSGCGYYGPPLPPALNIPRQVADLSVEQIGDKIVVRFTPPDRTTDNLPVADLRAITLYAGPGEADFSRDRWAATAQRIQVPVPVPAGPDASGTPGAPLEYELRAGDWAGQELVLAIRTTGRTGRESDWSEFKILPVGTPLDKPSTPAASNVLEGIELQWTGNAPRYRVLRSILGEPDPKLESVAETEAPQYLDRTTVYGVQYQYVILGLGLGGESRTSLPSDSATITPVDRFPPAAPATPAAVPGASAIDLSWTRNTEDDFAGYNVFRAEGDGPFALLAGRIAVPAYTDSMVRVGQRYRYAISAVDTAGNESDRSPEASAQIE